MKAITVIQPWASLLATGKKSIETRSWKTNYRGEILIHAGMKDPIFGIFMMSEDAREQMGIALELPEIYNRFEKFPTGAIIGKANLVNCVQIDVQMAELIRKQQPAEYEFGDFTPGRFAWVMTDAMLFERPIPARGKPGLWNYEKEQDI